MPSRESRTPSWTTATAGARFHEALSGALFRTPIDSKPWGLSACCAPRPAGRGSAPATSIRTTPWARQRELDDHRFTVDHFFVKLLRLEQTLHTDAGRAEARRRTAFMREFLRELGQEMGDGFVPDAGHGAG